MSTTNSAQPPATEGGLLKQDKGQPKKSLKVTFQVDDGAISDPVSSTKTHAESDDDVGEVYRLESAKEYIDVLFATLEFPYDQLPLISTKKEQVEVKVEATLPSPQDNSCEKEETAQTYVNELFDNLRAEFKYMQ